MDLQPDFETSLHGRIVEGLDHPVTTSSHVSPFVITATSTSYRWESDVVDLTTSPHGLNMGTTIEVGAGGDATTSRSAWEEREAGSVYVVDFSVVGQDGAEGFIIVEFLNVTEDES